MGGITQWLAFLLPDPAVKALNPGSAEIFLFTAWFVDRIEIEPIQCLSKGFHKCSQRRRPELSTTKNWFRKCYRLRVFSIDQTSSVRHRQTRVIHSRKATWQIQLWQAEVRISQCFTIRAAPRGQICNISTSLEVCNVVENKKIVLRVQGVTIIDRTVSLFL